jgi:hypothetical protein
MSYWRQAFSGIFSQQWKPTNTMGSLLRISEGFNEDEARLLSHLEINLGNTASELIWV